MDFSKIAKVSMIPTIILVLATQCIWTSNGVYYIIENTTLLTMLVFLAGWLTTLAAIAFPAFYLCQNGEKKRIGTMASVLTAVAGTILAYILEVIILILFSGNDWFNKETTAGFPVTWAILLILDMLLVGGIGVIIGLIAAFIGSSMAKKK